MYKSIQLIELLFKYLLFFIKYGFIQLEIMTVRLLFQLPYVSGLVTDSASASWVVLASWVSSLWVVDL